MKKPIAFSLTLTLLLASASLATVGTWAQKADMPTVTSLHAAAVVDGTIYTMGGTDNMWGYADYWPTVFAYDPQTDTWTRKADMPAGRARLATAVVDGKIYAIGGSPHADAEVSTVEMYDPATDVWSRRADLPRARNWLSASTVNGKIYAIGGKIYPSESMVSTVEVYDPATDTWTRKANMPTARGMHSASVVDGKIYVVGGVTGAYGPWISTVEMYDPVMDTWTRKTNMPTARTAHSSSALNGKIYVIGGANDWGYCLSTVEVYDPATDSWARETDMPTARLSHSASVVDGRIYVVGGSLHPSSWTPVSTVEVYDPGLIAPPPDFNGDGLVDIKDLLRLIESWGQNDPLVDLAPPLGDGIVDAHDLELLMSYWGQEPDDPTLITHWALDEMEGTVAYDSAGVNDAFVMGGTTWQPNSGQVNGALQLDGVDGCVVAGPILNPADGPFSVLAWIQGGGPGQVIISQLNGFNWLGADPLSGRLMTELCLFGRSGGPLQSETVVTDGDWHRVGLVWEGANRILYVDDVQVAEDTQDDLESSVNGLYIGTGKLMTPGTYWSGLVDDIRIYNRAVSP
ncbi:kelch repeat-containing protein [Planctomycetota bacterium]